MPVADFAKALRLGLGRTAVYLRDHDAAPYRDALLHACLHDLNYDDDFEDNRGLYLFRLIQLTGESEFYRSQILQALAASGDSDAAVQLFELAKYFALDGDAEARQVMYTRFEANSAQGLAIGGRSIIELDKATGLVAAAALIGGQPRDEEDDWYDDALLRIAQDAGVAEPEALLRQAASLQPRIADFLVKVETYRAKEAAKDKSHREPATLTFAEVQGHVTEKAPQTSMPGLAAWGKTASETDLQAAARELLVETDTRRLKRYLRIFYRRTFPLGPEPLIKFVADPDRVIAHRALAALEHFQHPAVRALALELLSTPNELAARAVALLVKNFEPGDHARIEALAAEPLDDEAFHSLGIEINDFFDAHPNPDSEERVLLRLYENDPCSQCRGRLVKHWPPWTGCPIG